MNETPATGYSGWALVEQMGFRKTVGKVTEVEMYGTKMLRLDIPALIIPGHDASHATSAARYLEECLPRGEYWDVAVTEQTEQRTSARLLEFLAAASGSVSPTRPESAVS